MPVPLYPLASLAWCGQCHVVLREGGGVAGGGVGSGWSGVGGHPPALGREAGVPRGPHVGSKLPIWGGAQGPGPPGSSGDAGGSRTRWTPVMVPTSCNRRKACTPSRASGAGRGGRDTGADP